MSVLKLVAALAIAACALGCAIARADPTSVSDGHAARGEALYQQHCAACHGKQLEGGVGVPLAGPTFLQRCKEENRSAADLLFFIRTFMPYDRPGQLPRQAYADIVAYLLERNGFAASASDLAAEPARTAYLTAQR